MSRAYRVSVSESISQTVRVEDGVCTDLEMLPVLPRERMGEILSRELEKEGFRRDDGKMTRADPDGVEISVELATAEVTVKAKADKKVEQTITRNVQADADLQPQPVVEATARAGLKRDLAVEVDKQREQLQEQVTARLEKKIGDIKTVLDLVVNRTTAEALKERSAQLGTVEAITEEPGGGMTIKVRL
jgi:hypothetical protein